MKIEELQKQIVNLQDEIKLKNSDIENYKNQINNLNETITNNKSEYENKINHYTEKINNLQNVNQQYFLRLIKQEQNLNIDNNIKQDKKEKFSNGLEFNDFINKL